MIKACFYFFDLGPIFSDLFFFNHIFNFSWNCENWTLKFNKWRSSCLMDLGMVSFWSWACGVTDTHGKTHICQAWGHRGCSVGKNQQNSDVNHPLTISGRAGPAQQSEVRKASFMTFFKGILLYNGLRKKSVSSYQL